ncbi:MULTISPECIES: peptide chain release factor H [unclassified Shinella]|uniref:peptide chain release factor H n=1 Tax=unclassified Shinella TaxID=2643062 RepID=UPI00225C46CA|nr:MULTISPECIES: peptide chain release factor H [unclassified Shinella]MCO5137643.1 peptide chain release factor H [Shinella sp.]MDC7257761.1 peptide chain release factor H [Shinella sp. YE25]CAI0335494.1 Peptide chain release factor H [Rhizobiaceae bacterium]CAK7259800.1 peptide chain release factor [Shinella sp. WSC3-e]
MTALDLLITAGNGPAECRIAVRACLDILEKEAAARGCLFEVSTGPMPDRHGPKSALVSLEGEAAPCMAAEFCGTVKFLFKSPVRPGHKRQNWFVCVQRVDLSGGEDVAIDPRDIRFETLRAGGPGGQHQNTTDSAVRAIHIPTGLRVIARNERSQHRNKALAVKRLAAMLQHLEDRKTDAAKSERFIANRSIERGNEVKTFKIQRP